MKLLILFSILLSIPSSGATDFTCPTRNITTGNGVFPPNTNTLTQFPKNYNCTIQFLVPIGSVVKFSIEANVTDIHNDALIVKNALGGWSIFQYDGGLFYAPASSAQVIIVQGANGTGKYWFSYQYVDITTLYPQNIAIGSPFPLNLKSTSSYTLTSTLNDHIVLHSNAPTQRSDSLTSYIHVYDGPDVKSPFIGTLYSFQYGNSSFVKSTGTSLTLVNLYGYVTQSFGLANEYSAISSFGFYFFYTYNSKNPIYAMFPQNATYTFYSTDTDEMIITSLALFKPLGVSPQDGVKFTPGTPSSIGNLGTVLAYSDNTMALPQLIPSNLMTMSSGNSQVSLKLSSDNDSLAQWIYPFPGRRGIVYSPSLWALGATPAYSLKFEAPTPLKFTFNIQSAVIASPGEQLSVQIGSTGSAPFTTTFTNSVANPGVRVANGTYMQVTYTGNNTGSSSIVTFEMADPNGGVLSSSTTPGVETTTTKLSGRISLFSVFLMIVAIVY